jgi:O-antigen/teichoic acid export membrane protein
VLAPSRNTLFLVSMTCPSNSAASFSSRTQACYRAALSYLSWETMCTGLATIVDQAIVSGTSFCLSVIVARKCSKEELGVYVLGMSVIQFVTGFQTSLITMPYTFYSPRSDGAIDTQYAGSALIHQFGLSILTVLTLLGAGMMVVDRVGVPGLDRMVWILGAVITFILLREFARRLCFAWLRPGTAILMDLLAAVTQVGGLLVLSRLGLLSAKSAYWVTGSACALAALWWLASIRQNFDVRWSGVIADLMRNWSFGKWILAGGLIYTARSELYPWFLAALHGTSATATFAACMGVVLFSNPFFIASSNFLGPKAAHNLASGGITALRRVVYKATLLVSVAVALFAVVLLFFGGRLVTLIYGARYAGGGPVVSVLVLGLLAIAVALGFDAGLYAMNRPRAIFQANLMGLGATALFGFWMAKYYGPLGAAYGFLASSVITSASKYFLFSRLCNADSIKTASHRLSAAGPFEPESVSMADTGTQG